jgi:predicted ribonuclease YlaK
MVAQTLVLAEYKHPNKEAEALYNQLIGIDEHKSDLLNTLSLLLNHKKIQEWQKKHHSKGISLLNHMDSGTPLVILSGDIGCGKTALAQTFATPLSNLLGQQIMVFENTL